MSKSLDFFTYLFTVPISLVLQPRSPQRNFLCSQASWMCSLHPPGPNHPATHISIPLIFFCIMKEGLRPSLLQLSNLPIIPAGEELTNERDLSEVPPQGLQA